jgi:hypothetical protein
MNVSDIIDLLGGPTAISVAVGLPSTTVQNWRIRQSIPARYQAEILTLAAGSVTADQIVAAHARSLEVSAPGRGSSAISGAHGRTGRADAA